MYFCLTICSPKLTSQSIIAHTSAFYTAGGIPSLSFIIHQADVFSPSCYRDLGTQVLSMSTSGLRSWSLQIMGHGKAAEKAKRCMLQHNRTFTLFKDVYSCGREKHNQLYWSLRLSCREAWFLQQLQAGFLE